jgi:hypothetical protein
MKNPEMLKKMGHLYEKLAGKTIKSNTLIPGKT